MAYLHPRIVHRDLKPQNVLLGADGRAKVCDFGIAKFKDRTFVSTVNGQAGTPAYMAPELFDGAQVTEKVDVYSFAVLVWECLTGRVPWADVPSPMQVIYYVGVLGQRPQMPAGCLPALRALIEACWAETPAARPRFQEVLVRLREMAAQVAAEGAGDLVQPVESAEQDAGAALDLSMTTSVPLTEMDMAGGLGPENAAGVAAHAVGGGSTRSASLSSLDAHCMHSYASSASSDATLSQGGASGGALAAVESPSEVPGSGV